MVDLACLDALKHRDLLGERVRGQRGGIDMRPRFGILRWTYLRCTRPP